MLYSGPAFLLSASIPRIPAKSDTRTTIFSLTVPVTMSLPESVSLRSFERISPTYASVSSSFLGSSRPLRSCTSVVTRTMKFRNGGALRLCCSDSNHSAPLPSTTATSTGSAPPVLKKKKRYRREYPGESKGITEELRFVAMRLHNVSGKKLSGDAVDSSSEVEVEEKDDGNLVLSDDDNDEDGDGTQTWQPSLEGFLKYLVDSKLVFSTVELIVDESSDVACKIPPSIFSSRLFIFRITKIRGCMIMLLTNIGFCDCSDLCCRDLDKWLH